jgi:hypothetical protein
MYPRQVTVLKVFGALAALVLVILSKWYQMRWIESQKEHKSGIQTIFSGRK